jgi:hypothetical protein
VADAIIATGRPAHAWLGITGRQITPAMAEALGHPGTRGVAVVEVDDRGPASDAGLRAATSPPDADVPRGGDLIVAVNGRPAEDMNQSGRGGGRGWRSGRFSGNKWRGGINYQSGSVILLRNNLVDNLRVGIKR